MNPNPKGLAQARTCGCGGCAKPVSKALYLSDASLGCHHRRIAVRDFVHDVMIFTVDFCNIKT